MLMAGTLILMGRTSKAAKTAGFTKRLKAFGFDYLLICAFMILLAGLTIGTIRMVGYLGFSLRWPDNPFFADLIAFSTLILPVILYFTLQESSNTQSTWGKRKVGIMVVGKDNAKLTPMHAFIRSLVKLIPWQIAHTCLFHIPGWPFAVNTIPPTVIAGFVLVYVLVGVYIACALISKQNRTPYDWAAGSYVVEKLS
jgi:uncharacterized RDD family membrane protein YckC